MQDVEDKLDSIVETVIAIPFEGSDDSDSEEAGPEETSNEPGPSFAAMYTPPALAARDLPGGARARMVVYADALARCRARVQEVLRAVHAPTAARVVAAVRAAYVPRESDRLMPYVELPAVAVSGTDRGATAALLEDVQKTLTVIGGGDYDGESDAGASRHTPALMSVLSPSDCANLASALKTLIGGFVAADVDGMDRDTRAEAQDRSGARTLAPYDMDLLEAWYDGVRKTRGEAELPKLVVLVNELEKIEPAIMQDVFYICSLHIPHLPLVFVLGLSTPPTPSYLNTVYPRATLALLRLTRVEVQGGVEVLERVLLDTFFDPCFAPPVILSPATLAFVIEQFAHTAQSIDFMLTILQLIFLRHYIDPLTILTADELLGSESIEHAAEKLSAPAARPFLLSLLARLHHPEKARAVGVDAMPYRSPDKGKGKEKEATCWRARTPLEALQLMRAVREAHEQRAQGTRVAFRIVLEVRQHLMENGMLKGREGEKAKSESVLCEMMGACLRGTLAGREGKTIASGIRKLGQASLSALLSALYGSVHALPATLRNAESETMVRIVDWNARLGSPSEDADIGEIASEVGEWLLSYMSDRMRDFTETNLWDVWYTGNPQGITELINPAPRAAIISALVHPDRYLGNANEGEDEDVATTSTQKRKGKHAEKLSLDTSVLFARYMESGRMVNVYDWYSAFAGALNAQRAGWRRRQTHDGDGAVSAPATRKRDRRKIAKNGSGSRSAQPSPSPSPRKGRGRGRGRGRRGTARGRVGAVPESDESDGDEDPESRGRWETQVQARFIRSVQELDFVGFVKHAGRKADHVHKTVYDLPEC